MRPSQCEGKFFLRGRWIPCPLAPQCYDKWLHNDGTYRETLYEFPATRIRGTIREISAQDPGTRERDRNRRYMALRYAFYRADELRRVREYNARSEVKERLRERWRKRWRDAHPLRYGDAAPTATLPCGEDCENCPYEECRYSDADRDKLDAELAARKRAEKAAYKAAWHAAHADDLKARWRERYATDEAYREAAKARSHARYAEKRDDINAARRAKRAAMSPEEREMKNAQRRARYRQTKTEEVVDDGKF